LCITINHIFTFFGGITEVVSKTFILDGTVHRSARAIWILEHMKWLKLKYSRIFYENPVVIKIGAPLNQHII